MTESIFVPFKLTTKESIEKAVKVLTSEPTPWPECEEKFDVVELADCQFEDFATKFSLANSVRM